MKFVQMYNFFYILVNYKMESIFNSTDSVTNLNFKF